MSYLSNLLCYSYSYSEDAQTTTEKEIILTDENQKSVKWAWSSVEEKKEESSKQEASSTDHLTSVLGNMKVEIEDVGNKYDDSDDSDDWDTDLEEDFKGKPLA